MEESKYNLNEILRGEVEVESIQMPTAQVMSLFEDISNKNAVLTKNNKEIN